MKEISFTPRQIIVLLELFRETSTGNSINNLLVIMANTSAKLVDANRATIFVFDDKTNELFSQVATGLSHQEIRIPSHAGIAGDTFSNNKINHISDPYQDSRFNQDIDKKTGYITRNILCIPLYNSTGSPLGCLQILNKNNGDFTEQDISNLMGISYQIGIAIENNLLYEALTESNNEITSNNRKLAAILNGIADSIVLIDDDFRLIMVNNSTKEILNVESEKLVGRKCYEALFGYNDFCQGCIGKKSFISGEVKRESFEIPIDSQKKVYERNCFPLKEEDGKVHKIIEYIKDVTNEHEMEEQLFQSKKLASIGTMASGIAHELKTPIAAISGNLQVLRSNVEKVKKLYDAENNPSALKLEERIKKQMGNIESYAEKAAYIIQELLTFSHKSTLTVENVMISTMIHEGIELVTDHHEGKKISYQLELDDFLEIQCDKVKVCQVLTNIIRNGVEEMTENGSMRIKSHVVDNYVEVRITDSANGMTEEIKNNIFDPFFTTKEAGMGTGLGLALCHKIIRQHKGHITVESQLGIGTTFSVWLPAGEKNTKKLKLDLQGEEYVSFQLHDKVFKRRLKSIMEDGCSFFLLSDDTFLPATIVNGVELHLTNLTLLVHASIDLISNDFALMKFNPVDEKTSQKIVNYIFQHKC